MTRRQLSQVLQNVRKRLWERGTAPRSRSDPRYPPVHRPLCNDQGCKQNAGSLYCVLICDTLVPVAIRNVRHSGLRRLFERGDGSKLHPAHVNRIRHILLALDGAEALNELSEPFYRLHPLKGDRKGQAAVTVSRMWRIVFRIEGDDVLDVDLTAYH